MRIKRTGPFFFLCVILGWGMSISAAPEGTDAAAPADAEYLELRDTWILEGDGGILHRREETVRLLTHYAFHRLFGESFITYNPDFQEVKILRSVTHTPDGREVPATPNAVVDVLPRPAAHAPPYLHLREKVVVHLGLEVGAVIEFAYEVRSRPGFMPYLMDEVVFSSAFPVKKRVVTVQVPEGTAFRYHFFRGEGAALEEDVEEGGHTYTWTLTDLPMDPPEPMRLDPADRCPYLVFSSCPSWKAAAELLNRRISEAAWLEEASEAVVRRRAKGITDPIALARSLNRFVAEETATAGVSPRLTGWKAAKAKDTFGAAVGSPLDKAVLLTAMLRFTGLFAEPVLLSRHRTVAKDVPCLAAFGEPRVLCTLRRSLDEPLLFEKLLLMDPTRLVAGLFDDRLAGRTLFRPSLLNDHLSALDPSSAETNTVTARLRLTLEKNRELGGTLYYEATGACAPILTVMDDAPSFGRRRLSRLLPGAEIAEVNPLLLEEGRCAFRGKTGRPARLEEPAKDIGLAAYSVPFLPGGVHDLHLPVALAKRRTPLELPRALHVEVDVAVELPEGVVLAAAPEPVERNTPAGTLRSAVWVDEGVLHAHRAITLPRVIPVKDYPAFRRLIVDWEAEDARRVILDTKGNGSGR